MTKDSKDMEALMRLATEGEDAALYKKEEPDYFADVPNEILILAARELVREMGKRCLESPLATEEDKAEMRELLDQEWLR